MITDQDVTKLKKTFVTKSDLAKLKKTFVTKKEFRLLEKKVDGLVYEVGDLKIEFAEMKENLESFVNRMETKMDGFLGTMDRLDIEDKAATSILDRHTSQIDALATVHTSFILPT